MGNYMLKNKILSKKELDEIEKEAAAAIESAVAYAEKSAYPSIDTILDDVYA
jgi:pyruvate dehydrogenase E1 component alpha subunit